MRRIIAILDNDLESALSNDVGLIVIRNILEKYKNTGIQAGEVNLLLEELRRNAGDEATEDRIAGVMDIVSGFCFPHMRVW